MTAEIPKELTEAYEKAISYIFHLMPVSEMDIDSVIAEDIMIYGTTVDENIFGLDDFKKFKKLQAEEMEGLNISYERIPISQIFPKDGLTGLFVEEVTVTVKTGETTSENNVRLSVLMEKRDGFWKLIHAHGSKPVEPEQDFWHINEWKAEKEKLEKKVAEQTANLQKKNLELEIEGATERVRAEAMGMQKPDDLLAVLEVIKAEIDRFGLGNNSTWLWTIRDNNEIVHWELADHFAESTLEALNLTFDANENELAKSFSDQIGNNFFIYHYKDQGILDYLNSVSELLGSDVVDAEAAEHFRDALESGKITSLWQACSTFNKGLLGLMFVTEPPDITKQILIKITDAFAIAYQRYLDIEEAEQRRKKAELEASADRVRAHAMGMQKPDDIMNVLNVIKTELDQFDLGNIGTWFWIFNGDNTLTQWDISETGLGGSLNNINITVDLEASIAGSFHGPKWHKEEYYNMPWNGDPLQQLIDEIIELDPKGGQIFQELVDNGEITTYWQACAPFSRGVLGLDFAIEPPDDVEPILTKLGSVFGMAYQRFEDLQKAEAQARESRIEAALERIRSQSLAMQSSNELRKVADVLYEQMRDLDQPLLEGSAIHFYDKYDDDIEAWFSMPTGNENGELSSGSTLFPKDACWVTKEWMRHYESDQSVYEVLTTTDQQEEWLSVLETHIPDIRSIVDIDNPHPTHMHFVDFSGGALGVISPHEISDEVKSLQKRAAAVFDLAYRRYEDLKKSELQAYESKVEASLERVRGMAAAMNHSDDLKQIAEAMFKEMEILRINPLRFGLGIIDPEKKEAELWASTVNDGKYLDILGKISLTWHPMLQQVFDAWDAQHEELIYELYGKERADYYKKVGRVNPHIPDLKKLQDPSSNITQYVSFFPFKSGAMYAFTEIEPDEKGKSILKRFANVFEQAHIRYDDLQMAEKQARLIREERDRLEIALKELEATKDQLVQQEKLASLGQLTAGIAHEIKNPLNFVNNFSELSVELVEEVRSEIRDLRRKTNGERSNVKSETGGETPLSRGVGVADGNTRGVSDEAEDCEYDSELIMDILNDIEANLKTIHKHGTRADSIVKSMLQHSRGSDGKMEPTELNPLIKEYVNLAFHGMRAGKDPINVDIDLQLDESVGEVPLIGEDFSRVVLNLVNNAFDAMGEKAKDKSEMGPSKDLTGFENLSGLDDYQPKLSIRSSRNENTVTIEIEDNGPGIPDEIKDKILQPFFTTKKGTQGTGLGLSITNDIIKAHGGFLHINASEKGSIFTIQIPRA
jgi:signal transduction histidine kinase